MSNREDIFNCDKMYRLFDIANAGSSMQSMQSDKNVTTSINKIY